VIYEIHRKPTFDIHGDILYLNPIELVQDIKSHFLGYVDRLQNPANRDLRENFVEVFGLGVIYDPGAGRRDRSRAGGRGARLVEDVLTPK
jgi:hypothetical protein